jgi:hypothetical protein
LPLQADRTPNGFDIAFLRIIEGNIARTARIRCVVEDVAQVRSPLARYEHRHASFYMAHLCASAIDLADSSCSFLVFNSSSLCHDIELKLL